MEKRRLVVGKFVLKTDLCNGKQIDRVCSVPNKVICHMFNESSELVVCKIVWCIVL